MAVSDPARTFHLTRPWLYGPAERTLIEPWLTTLSGQVLNAYDEVDEPVVVPMPDRSDAVRVLVPTRLLRPEEYALVESVAA
ncbi:hypothetical protein GCM10022416_45260 [Actinomadura keratinilytica]|uniref:Uncharacterized protein n=1 Tax=Actinomadura keratinilytica TaxID=547461 RepID=A0ABP7Z8F9_9ACTN